MELQTIIKPEKPDFQVSYTTRMMMLGSCFVENIGARLEYFRFKTDINPCGIVYNPLSVANTLNILMEDKRFSQDDLWEQEGRWGSFSHHSSFCAPDAAGCLQKINTRLEEATGNLKQADVLVITWGTSWVYRHCATNRVVANCHKFPAADFERYRLTVEDIENVYVDLLGRLRNIRPELRVLFTVSPIRHWKDGAHGNQLSKAVLLLAIDRLVNRFDYVSYFPSYEIVMDELRDYRFYAEDMLHISPQGVEYIWEKFRDVYMSGDTVSLMKRVDKLNRILLHRPFDPENEVNRRLRRQAEEELGKLLV